MSNIYHLYVKTHNITGLKYLGRTTVKDPYKYPGSGKWWTHHLKKYGNDVGTHIILSTENLEALKWWGLYFSELWDIVKSDEWANLCPENGYTTILSEDTKKKIGQKVSLILLGHEVSDETKQKISAANKGRRFTEQQKENMSRGSKGKKLSPEHKIKIGLGGKGKKHSLETRTKMSEAFTPERKQKYALMRTGSITSEETKRKLSLARQKYCAQRKALTAGAA